MPNKLSASPANRISRLRHLCATMGLGLRKSRCRSLHMKDLGGFMIVDTGRNAVVAGDRYHLDLDDVSDFLADLASRPDAPTWGLSLPTAAA